MEELQSRDSRQRGDRAEATHVQAGPGAICQSDQALAARGEQRPPGVPHLVQGVVGGVVKCVGAAGPALGGEHLLLLLV